MDQNAGMPILVDRDRQRDHVAYLAAQVVADEGVGALTFRRMAAAAGTSTAIVSTYFEDKRDLLLSTYASTSRRTSVRFEAAMAAGGGLRECLEAWLPLDQERMLDWRVVIAFWGVAVSDPDLAGIQEATLRRARARVEQLILQQRGTSRVTREVAQKAQIVLALTVGIAFQAAFESPDELAIRQRQLLKLGLDEAGLLA